jgi:hypothetical protein
LALTVNRLQYLIEQWRQLQYLSIGPTDQRRRLFESRSLILPEKFNTVGERRR